jgi:DNA-binding NtrC family response regulator
MADEVVVVGSGERAAKLAAVLRAAGYAVAQAADGHAARAVMTEPGVTMLAADLAVPELDRQALLAALAVDGDAPPPTLEEMERRQIVAALRHTRGNRRDAARLLGIARSTLHAKLHRYDIH